MQKINQILFKLSINRSSQLKTSLKSYIAWREELPLKRTNKLKRKSSKPNQGLESSFKICQKHFIMPSRLSVQKTLWIKKIQLVQSPTIMHHGADNFKIHTRYSRFTWIWLTWLNCLTMNTLHRSFSISR